MGLVLGLALGLSTGASSFAVGARGRATPSLRRASAVQDPSDLLEGLELRLVAEVADGCALSADVAGRPVIGTAAGVLRLAGPRGEALAVAMPGDGPVRAVLDLGSRVVVQRGEALHAWERATNSWGDPLPGQGHLVLLPDGRVATFAHGTLSDPTTTPTTPLTEPGRAARLLVEVTGRVHAVELDEAGGPRARSGLWGLPLPTAAEPAHDTLEPRALLYRSAALDDPMHALDGALLVLTRGRPGLTALLPAPDGCSRAWSGTTLWSTGPALVDLAAGPDGEVLVLDQAGGVRRLAAAGLEPLPPLEPRAEGPAEAPFAPALEALASPSPAARGLALDRLLAAGDAGLQALRRATAHPRPVSAARPLWNLARSGPPVAGFVEQLLHREEPALRGAALAALLTADALSPAALTLTCADDEACIRALAAPQVPSLGWPGGLAALDALVARWSETDRLESAALRRATLAAESLDPNWWRTLPTAPAARARALWDSTR